jgi:hypothetical protein
MEKAYYNLGQMISLDECAALSQEVLEMKEQGALTLETNPDYYNGSFGGVTSGSHRMLQMWTPLVRQITGLEVIPANPFCRIYPNGSVLKPHRDREGLDWTISICLFSNLSHTWPLLAKVEDDVTIGFDTIVAHGNLINGRKYSHWREPLECGPDEYVIQMFLHWTAPSIG